MGSTGGRSSKDEILNGEGKKLLNLLEEMGWFILNGNIEGKEEGEYTRTERKKRTVIDYVIVD